MYGPFWPIPAYFRPFSRCVSAPIDASCLYESGGSRMSLDGPLATKLRPFWPISSLFPVCFRPFPVHIKVKRDGLGSACSATLRCAPPRPRLQVLGGHYDVSGHFRPFPVFFRPYLVNRWRWHAAALRIESYAPENPLEPLKPWVSPLSRVS